VPINVAREQLGIPHQVDAVVLKALSKDPAKRFQTAHELKEALEKVNFALESGRITAPMTAPEQASAVADCAVATPADAACSTVSDASEPVEAQKHTKELQANSITTGSSTTQPVSEPAQAAPARSTSLRTIGIVCAGAVLLGVGVWLGSTLLRPAQAPPQTPSVSTAQPQSGTDALWKEQNDKGQQAFDAGKYDEAEKYFLSAIKEAEKFGEHDHRLLSSLRKLSDVYYTLGKDKEAEQIDARITTLKSRK